MVIYLYLITLIFINLNCSQLFLKWFSTFICLNKNEDICHILQIFCICIPNDVVSFVIILSSPVFPFKWMHRKYIYFVLVDPFTTKQRDKCRFSQICTNYAERNLIKHFTRILNPHDDYKWDSLRVLCRLLLIFCHQVCNPCIWVFHKFLNS